MKSDASKSDVAESDAPKNDVAASTPQCISTSRISLSGYRIDKQYEIRPFNYLMICLFIEVPHDRAVHGQSEVV